MKRHRKRAMLKQSRCERSRRRKYHWDANEVIERVFPETKWPETRCASGLALARLHSEAEWQCAQ